jgi:hypothetical protein
MSPNPWLGARGSSAGARFRSRQDIKLCSVGFPGEPHRRILRSAVLYGRILDQCRNVNAEFILYVCEMTYHSQGEQPLAHEYITGPETIGAVKSTHSTSPPEKWISSSEVRELGERSPAFDAQSRSLITQGALSSALISYVFYYCIALALIKPREEVSLPFRTYLMRPMRVSLVWWKIFHGTQHWLIPG